MAITKTSGNVWREAGTATPLEEYSGRHPVAREGRKCAVCKSPLNAYNNDPHGLCAICRSRVRKLGAGAKPNLGDVRDVRLLKIAQDTNRGRRDLYH